MNKRESIRHRAFTAWLTLLFFPVPAPRPVWAEEPSAPNGDGRRDAAAGEKPGTRSLTVLDLIPRDAALAIGVPNLMQLKERGDRLFAATDSNNGIRISELFESGYKWLGIQRIVDERRPAAAMMVNVRDVGLGDADSFEGLMETLVIHVPVADMPEAAKRFALTSEAIRKGTIVPTSGNNAKYACLRGDYLLLAWNRRAIESVLEGESLASEISADRRADAEKSDVLVLAGTKSWGKTWDEYVDDVRKGEVHLPDVPRKEELLSLLQKTVPDARFALLTVHIDDGVQLRLLGRFQGGGTAEAALAELGSRAEPASLSTLPQGNLLAALAASGQELASLDAARLLLPVVLDGFSQREFFERNDPGRLLATFDAVRPQLNGCRIALYATGATTPTELSDRGSMAAVFVLDTDDPQKLLESIARDGIALGGSRENAEAEGEPAARLPLRHLPNQQTIGGRAVDHLELDTGSVEPEIREALREAFGPSWMFLRAAEHDGRVVILLGSELELLADALRNLDAAHRGVLEAAALQSARLKLDTAHQAALYLSLRRTMPALAGFADDSLAAMNQEVDRISAFAAVIEDDAVQIEIWVPLSELQAIPEKWRRLRY